MVKLTLRNLVAHKLRFLLTGISILLGVAFMAGTFVFSDTINSTFNSLFTDLTEGVDDYVRAEATEGVEDEAGTEIRGRIDQSLTETVAAVDGVEAVDPTVAGSAVIIGSDDEALNTAAGGGPPSLGFSWPGVDAVNPAELVDGRAPEAPGEAVIDKASADEGELTVGDQTELITKVGLVPVEIVGIAKYGAADSPGGASVALLPFDQAQQVFAEPGRIDAIEVVAEEGVSQEELRGRIAEVLPGGVEVITGEQLQEENQNAIEQGLSFFNTFLLVFALVALFVGAFIISNTFTIVVAQRSRELALLRAVGASRRQTLASVLIEASALGVVASFIGLFVGVLVAIGLRELLAGFGFDIPTTGLTINPDRLVIPLVTGVVVTVVSAIFPARRASQVAPIEALRDVSIDRSGSSLVRLVVGAAVAGLGIVALISGLAGAGIQWVGLGAPMIFVGVAMLGPIIAVPVTKVLSWPLPRLRGMVGTLARQNALRNPKRTSATASALMIGVALVGFLAIFAASVKGQINRIVDDLFTGDLVITSASFDVGLPVELADQVAAIPGVEAVAQVRFAPASVDGDSEFLSAVNTDNIEKVLDPEVTDGSLDNLGTGGIAVDVDTADDEGWALGQEVTVGFAETGDQTFTVEALYDDDTFGNYLIGLAAYDANVADRFDQFIFIDAAEGVDVDALEAELDQLAEPYPLAQVQNRAQYKEDQAAQVNQILGLMFALLALAILIALIGIANTLALSIHERTRELGLLRAVGMSRGQVRASVRWESVVIALFGTALGLVIGVFFAWSIIRALADQGFDVLSVPPGQLALIAVVAAFAGVLAAILPARRAARLDVLEAIATE